MTVDRSEFGIDSRHSASMNLPKELTAGWIGFILLAHGTYGLLLVRSPALASVHAYVTLAVAVWLAMTSTMRQVALACAYMAGSEILWRLGKAAVPWEFVKYGICLIALISLARVSRLRWDWVAVTYLAFLIPSALLAFMDADLEAARQQISFNLSGPLTLAITCWFFANWRPSQGDVQRMFLAVLAPVFSLALIVVTRTASAEELVFSDASNRATSAGYGPNQVSLALGFGALLAVLLALLLERRTRDRALLGAVALVLGAQSALTFSRGGLFSALGAIVIAIPFLLQGARSRLALLIGAVALVVIAEFFVLPRLDAFTGGALTARFQDTQPTGRDELIKSQLETFLAHPIFGTGPGGLIESDMGMASAHTEFTRLPAQHGILGIAALIAMFALAWRAVRSQRNPAGRAIAVALIGWSLLSMGHAGMRLAIIPFAFGLAAAGFLGVSPFLPESSAMRARQGIV